MKTQKRIINNLGKAMTTQCTYALMYSLNWLSASFAAKGIFVHDGYTTLNICTISLDNDIWSMIHGLV